MHGNETQADENRVIRQPIEEEGLVGTLFYPATPGPHPTVIVLGGSNGGLWEGGAEILAREGFATLALAHFGVDPLPSELVEIPLEYFGNAVAWLKAQTAVAPDRIAVMGGSKGGELALLLGTAYPKDIKAVVGSVPSGVVWQGISFSRQARYPRSSWSLGGEPLPFVRFAAPRLSELPGWIGFMFGRSFAFRPFYERALGDEAAITAAAIAVEKINGPVLLISGTDDQMWPSSRLSDMVIERLAAHDHPFYYKHLCYEGAGHAIMIPGTEPDDTTRAERFKLGGSRETNARAIADSWTRVLDFLKEHLKQA